MNDELEDLDYVDHDYTPAPREPETCGKCGDALILRHHCTGDNMQVNKALDELKWIRKGLEDARQWRDWDEVARLRGRVSHVMALLKPNRT